MYDRKVCGVIVRFVAYPGRSNAMTAQPARGGGGGWGGEGGEGGGGGGGGGVAFRLGFERVAKYKSFSLVVLTLRCFFSIEIMYLSLH